MKPAAITGEVTSPGMSLLIVLRKKKGQSNVKHHD